MGQIISAFILVSFVAGALAFSTIEQSRSSNSNCERSNTHALGLHIQLSDKESESTGASERTVSDLSHSAARTDSIEHQIAIGSHSEH